ncbi:TRAF-like family protein [Euphorbia peplus]|nr:TRAF-like family protein [Euphorbia peplus]
MIYVDNLSAYYTLQIQKFQPLNDEVNKYESAIFEAKGYKWKLVIYPNGNGLKEVKHHLSIYLELMDKIEPDQMVYAVFRLYLLDQKNHDDFVLPDTQGEGRERCFHQMKLEWGFDRFIHTATFCDPSNGYLMDDTCTLGVEIVSVRPERVTGKGEFFSLAKEVPASKFTWKIGKFSKRKERNINSSIFSVGDHEWRIELYPMGTSYGQQIPHVSLYLSLANHIAIKGRIYADVTLRILDQIKDRHIIGKDNFWFDESNPRHGWSRFVPLYHLNRSKDFLLFKDVCFVEAEVRVLGVANAL